MKKKIILSNIVSFVVGLIICGGVVYAANLLASEVAYDNTQSGLTATNVQSALDELNTKANAWIDPSVLNGKGYYTNSAKSMIATQGGILLIRNGTTHLIRNNNWSEEKDHIQQVFSDISCSVDSSSVSCNASDFKCGVRSNGIVNCYDQSGGSYCNVGSSGIVYCN